MAEPQKQQAKVIFAIDFGTTYSGIGYFFTDDPEEHLYVVTDWGSRQGMSLLKTPTALLLKPNGDFHKFGHAAVEEYAKKAAKSDFKEYLFFDKFKLLLHTEKVINKDTKISASNGKRWPACTVFAHCLQYLRDVGQRKITDVCLTTKYKPRDFKWVLTVPAIWSLSAKQFMRSAAYQAGIGNPENPDQLIIALEPEAASYYCLSLPMKMFFEQDDDQDVASKLQREGVPYMVIDNGGGTLDVTVHEIRKDGIVEKHCPTGGIFGGIHVDEEFELMMEKAFGPSFIKEFKKEFPYDWLTIMNNFEVQKRGDPADEDEISMHLPLNFVCKLNPDLKQSDADLNKKIGKQIGDGVSLSGGWLNISIEKLTELHHRIITQIAEHVFALLQKSEVTEVKTIFMVGGFSKSQFLRQKMKEKLQGYHLMTPPNPELAIIKGALQFAKDPYLLRARVLSKTHGIDTCCKFDPRKHRKEKKIVVGGVDWCDDVFKVLVQEKETVEVNEVRSFTFCPLNSSQKSVAFRFYSTNNKLKEVDYVTDPGIIDEFVEIEVPSPDTTKGVDREIKLDVYFGRTETKVEGTDVETGKSVITLLKLA